MILMEYRKGLFMMDIACPTCNTKRAGNINSSMEYMPVYIMGKNTASEMIPDRARSKIEVNCLNGHIVMIGHPSQVQMIYFDEVKYLDGNNVLKGML